MNITSANLFRFVCLPACLPACLLHLSVSDQSFPRWVGSGLHLAVKLSERSMIRISAWFTHRFLVSPLIGRWPHLRHLAVKLSEKSVIRISAWFTHLFWVSFFDWLLTAPAPSSGGNIRKIDGPDQRLIHPSFLSIFDWLSRHLAAEISETRRCRRLIWRYENANGRNSSHSLCSFYWWIIDRLPLLWPCYCWFFRP